jgi:hypothetical protein
MQISAELKVKDRVLALDATTLDAYDSVEVVASNIRIVMPTPLWLRTTGGKKGAKIGVVIQWTSSGTLDIKYHNLTEVELSEEEAVELAKAKVRADRLSEATADADDVDEDSDEFKKALKEVKASDSKSDVTDVIDPVLVKLDDDGNPISPKN